MTAQELKNSILQLAIQGKLVKQDPNDEPASVLLEKIKEERKKLIEEKKIKKEKYSEIYKDSSDNHYYEKFEDGTINDITDEIPFEIPESWNFIRFNNLINYKIGKTPPRGEKTFWKNDYNWVSISDMIDGNTIKETKEMVSQKAYNNVFNNGISTKGTLLMSFKLTIGKVSILDIDSFHNEAIISIYPYYDKENILRDYLFKILPLISNYGSTKNAIKGKTLNSKSIDNLLIPITNLNEINKITDKIISLEPIIESYNNKFLQIERLNNTYKEDLKKSILQYAIQGKLVKQDPDDESAEVLISKILEKKRELIKNKQIKKENLSVIYKDSTDNQFYEKFDDGKIVNITDEIPFDIPENWAWSRIGNIYFVIRGSSPRPKGSPLYWAKEKTNYHWITIKDISTFKLDKYLIDTKDFLTIEGSKRSTYVEKNNIIIAVSGSTTGKSCILGIDGYIYDGLAALISFSQDIYSCYVYYYFQFLYDYLNSQKIGSAIPNINTDVLKHTFIPIPPLKEQYTITSKIKKLLNLI